MKSRRIAVAAAGLVLLSSICSAAPSADDADSALGQDADYNAGRVALKNGDPAAAVRRFEAALARFPDAADLHNELGFAHRKLAHYDKAFKHYKRALARK